MAISFLLKINGIAINHIKSYKVGQEKLWVDADRNMAGELRSTLIGIFPKIYVEFTSMPGDDLADLMILLDAPSFSLEYWDPKSQTVKTATYYSNTYETPVYSKDRELFSPFSVNLIPYSKAT